MRSAAQADPAEAVAERVERRRFPIVAMGASAGGLAPLEELFAHMPAKSGIAFVVITHQHLGQTSLLPELLSRKTAMPVVQVTKPVSVEPDHVYTSAPGLHLAIINGVLQPTVPTAEPPLYMPVDYFFRSLAQDQRGRAIGIVLSGTGSDGSLGLKEIKGALGMVMVQDEQSAQFSGMPHSAIATELVDYVLPVAQMPKQLLSYVRSLALGVRARRHAGTKAPLVALQQILGFVRRRTGHDFALYKRSTLERRIERRMNVHHLDSANAYVRYLQANPGEVDQLFKELLIGVTSFFRDPEAWIALAAAICESLKDKPDDYVVRAWVAGCSTGEEAYSLAILLRECMDTLKRSFSVQIFATDLDASAIEVARMGVYPGGIANDLTLKRLARFFTQEDGGYRVKKKLREMIVFAPQNLIADPPFTRLDVLSCRNLLIYFDTQLQKRLLPIFHYALRPKGLLVLGSSESIGAFGGLFASVDKKWKIFVRDDSALGSYVAEFPAAMPEPHGTSAASSASAASASQAVQMEHIVDAMLKELVPPTVLVQERGDVVHIHGRTGKFLEPPQGLQARPNVFDMARQGLQVPLASAIRQAATSEREIVRRGVQVKTNGDFASVNVRVVRLREPVALRGLFRVAFELVEAPSQPDASDPAGSDEPSSRLAEIERELQYTKEIHQSTIEELESANEETKSANEELQSTNEELQSANEELETSKEEMQSLNEELQTVNSELQGKVDELSRTNNDMRNLLNATDIATVFLDNELRIKRFTEQAKSVIRLIPTDVGRPIGDLVSTLQYDRLVDDARQVLQTLVFKATEVRGQDGEAYLLRILPYRTSENVIDGLVLTFVDVTKIKTLQEEQARLIEALKNSPTSVFGQDPELRFTWAGSPVFGRRGEELVGKSDRDVFSRQDAEKLAAIKRKVLATGDAKRERVALVINGEPRTYDLYVEARRDASMQVTGLSCVATDMTEPH